MNVNARSTAVRLTHLPSGIAVKCQESRHLVENEKVVSIMHPNFTATNSAIHSNFREPTSVWALYSSNGSSTSWPAHSNTCSPPPDRVVRCEPTTCETNGSPTTVSK